MTSLKDSLLRINPAPAFFFCYPNPNAAEYLSQISIHDHISSPPQSLNSNSFNIQQDSQSKCKLLVFIIDPTRCLVRAKTWNMHIAPRGIQVLIFSLGLQTGINNHTPFYGPPAAHNPNKRSTAGSGLRTVYSVLDHNRRKTTKENEEHYPDLYRYRYIMLVLNTHRIYLERQNVS